MPLGVQERIEARHLHFMGGIHALEHGAIGVFPLLVLCDRNDIGGIAYPFHPQVMGPAVFIYDGYPGGVGLTRQAFSQMAKLLQVTSETIGACDCEVGCPSCVHSPKCGSGNRPIDKHAAAQILEALLADKPEAAKAEKRQVETGSTGAAVALPDRSSRSITRQPEIVTKSSRDNLRYAVFDVETKRSAAEVGGWHRAERMGISVAVLYDSHEDAYSSYLEEEMGAMIKRLQEFDLVIGFNNKRFDNQVLSAYTDFSLHSLPTLDLLEEVRNRLGYRLSLNHLAEHTLGVKKSGDGLQALRWYKQGRIDKIIDYCRMDVEITKDLYLFGKEHDYLLFQNKAGMLVRCPTDFTRPIMGSDAGMKFMQRSDTGI